MIVSSVIINVLLAVTLSGILVKNGADHHRNCWRVYDVDGRLIPPLCYYKCSY